MDNSYCCVPQCNSLGSNIPRTSFHRFPRTKNEFSRRRRLEWIRLLKIGKMVSDRMVVCGKHFQRSDFLPRNDGPLARTKLKFNALPSLNLPLGFRENGVMLNEKKEDSLMGLSRKEMRESASVAINTVPEPGPVTQDAHYYVLDCFSDPDKSGEESKTAQKSNTLFLPPEEDKLLEKWKRMIPVKEEILSSDDSDYELHFEEGYNETYSQFDTSQELKEFFKLSAEVKNMSTPNSWWSVVCTDNCIIFAKWNSHYSSERRVVIRRDLSIKTFLMNVEVSLSIEGWTIESVSQLLHKVDEFIICENAGSGTSSGCLGFVEDKRQEFCHTCYESKKTEKDVQRGNAQFIVGKKMKSISQVKNINRIYTHQKKVSDSKSEHVESDLQHSPTKEVFLDAISLLPTEQQTTIKSCLSFKTWF